MRGLCWKSRSQIIYFFISTTRSVKGKALIKKILSAGVLVERKLRKGYCIRSIDIESYRDLASSAEIKDSEKVQRGEKCEGRRTRSCQRSLRSCSIAITPTNDMPDPIRHAASAYQTENARISNSSGEEWSVARDWYWTIIQATLDVKKISCNRTEQQQVIQTELSRCYQILSRMPSSFPCSVIIFWRCWEAFDSLFSSLKYTLNSKRNYRIEVYTRK